MTFKRRRIFNRAVEFSQRNAEGLYRQNVSEVEDLRKSRDMSRAEVEDLLSEPSNWYNNRITTRGTHLFSLEEFLRLYRLLDDGDPAEVSVDERLEEIEEMREIVEISESRIEKGLNRAEGWYDRKMRDERDLTLLEYYELLLVVEFLVSVYESEGYLSDPIPA